MIHRGGGEVKLTYSKGKSYIVKDREGNKSEVKILVLADTSLLAEWNEGRIKSVKFHDLQKFRFEYKIIEEVG